MGRRASSDVAGHPSNQVLLDFLTRQIASTELKAPRKGLFMRKARNSLAQHDQELRTEDDMRKLHGIGSWLAQQLFRERCRIDGTLGLQRSNSATSASSMRGLKRKSSLTGSASAVSGSQSSLSSGLLSTSITDGDANGEIPFKKDTVPHSILRVLYLNRNVEEPMTLDLLAELVRRYRAGHKLPVPTKERILTTMRCKLEDEGLAKRRQHNGVEVVALTEAARKRVRRNLEDLAENEGDDDDDDLAAMLPPRQDSTESREAPNAIDETLSSFTFTPCARTANLPVPLAEQNEEADRPHEWELVLLIDMREGSGRDKTIFQSKLFEHGVNIEKRVLSLGDAMWIVRRKLMDGKTEEYVLDYIIERKEVSDLGTSIKDGRYSEQKYRLQRCGLSRVIYLVEGEPSHQSILKPQALRTAMAETQVRDGFTVMHVLNVMETVEYLSRMHRLIESSTVATSQNKWSGPARDSWRRYENFHAANVKGKLRSVNEIFGAQLKQIKGFSGMRAAAILEKYPTPRSLLELFDEGLKNVPEEYKQSFFQNMEIPGQLQNLGPVASTNLFHVFNHRIGSNR
ncbi:Crossover junction endonuclease MUS81 [Hondaea fermentalgiana]|uniref:Crossover junction endonuclease MUS81 n=1 Tax=Hondaea fermentalgiana TaxID=2315210 RepID=A0A2R5FYX3_9STRA|nr:Crossover junction endonuclease MUS81 [Hondaea fermentalgiana]|eukprot:GBG23952.1 Crossover junction endonuclease MUS81 [Hondaea fermentalgiana]